MCSSSLCAKLMLTPWAQSNKERRQISSELDLGDYLREWSRALEVPLSNTLQAFSALGLKWE